MFRPRYFCYSQRVDGAGESIMPSVQMSFTGQILTAMSRTEPLIWTPHSSRLRKLFKNFKVQLHADSYLGMRVLRKQPYLQCHSTLKSFSGMIYRKCFFTHNSEQCQRPGFVYELSAYRRACIFMYILRLNPLEIKGIFDNAAARELHSISLEIFSLNKTT